MTHLSAYARLVWKYLPQAAAWLLPLACAIYAALLWAAGDVWWVATILLFAPRWLLLPPLVITSLWSAIRKRRLLWLNGMSLFILLVPVMGFSVPIANITSDTYVVGDLTVMTANIGGANPEQMKKLLDEIQPDIIFLQECRSEKIPSFLDPHLHIHAEGNLCIASKYPIAQSAGLSAALVDRWGSVAIRAQIQLPEGIVWAVCLHLETPRWGFQELAVTRQGIQGSEEVEELTQRRDAESKLVRAWVDEVEGSKIVAGDFNMPVESRIYRRHWGDLENAFSNCGWGFGYTKYTRWHGVRIDHVLSHGAFSSESANVKGRTGGDHCLVHAEFRIYSNTEE